MPKTGKVFYRCILRDVIYASKGYTRTNKRNNFTVLYSCNGDLLFSEIDFFLYVSVNQIFHVYACVKQLVKQNSNKDHFHLPHSALDYGVPRIVQVTIGEPKVLIDVSSILCKCVSVSIHPYTYVCIPPNTILLD